MRTLFAVAVLAVPAVAQELPVVPARYSIPGNPRLFPQTSAKEALASAIKAVEAERYDYLVAHILDEKFVEARIAERARLLEPAAEAELIARRDRQRQNPAAVLPADELPREPTAFAEAVKAEAKVRGYRQVVQDARDKFTEDPSILKDLRRFLREGDFAGDATAAKGSLKDIKDRQLFFKQAGGRWFVENRQADEKEGDK